MTFKERIAPYLSNIDQLAWARMSEITDGAGRGNRIIDVDNGSGLRFSISPDRGMDIVEASYNGVPIAFRTPGGHRSRMEYDPVGIGWLRTWQGGLLTTCGLRTAGTPDEGFGLHGRIDNLPAEDVGILRYWAGDEYRIQARGVIREAAMFGENLQLERSIVTALGKNIIGIHDRVTNLSAEKDYVQIVYHCNFGYPLVSPDVRVIAPEHQVEPRDAAAAADLANWNGMPAPMDGNPPEQCFFHTLPATAPDDFAVFTLENPKLGIRASVCYDVKTLPRLCQWRLFRKGMYVMGVEPTNTRLNGRNAEIAAGSAVPIEPGQTLDFRVRIVFDPVPRGNQWDGVK